MELKQKVRNQNSGYQGLAEGEWEDVQWIDSYERWINSRDLLYDIEPVMNNTELCT